LAARFGEYIRAMPIRIPPSLTHTASGDAVDP
jgi:hypothetical protein